MDDPTPLDRFRSACFDWLESEDPSRAPMPSLDGLTPEEVARARSWLRSLVRARRWAAGG